MNIRDPSKKHHKSNGKLIVASPKKKKKKKLSKQKSPNKKPEDPNSTIEREAETPIRVHKTKLTEELRLKNLAK